ncbi:MAG: helix-turn-helix transcriptional regulator [Azoarcus sp.]|nr:helix-turn-helix transcriptional regulator [Azoarcus sp.]
MSTPINLYDYVMSCLRAREIPQRTVASESGVPFSTLAKIAQGSVRHPSVHTIQRLADFFTSRQVADDDGLPDNLRTASRPTEAHQEQSHV